MKRIQGVEAPKALGELSEDLVKKAFAELNYISQELQTLKPPSSIEVESYIGRS